MTRRILVTGGQGQIGLELGLLASSAGFTTLRPSRAELDLCDPGSVKRFFQSNDCDAIINCAAYTDVDRAETEIAEAWAANAVGPALLAAEAARLDVPIVQLSTDYVFDGRETRSYREDDLTSPINVYGGSKLGGEIAVRSNQARAIVLRTAWVVSPHRKNFVKTMLRLAALGQPIRVVDDQIGSPTAAADIAVALITITDRMVHDRSAPGGVYHFVNRGETSWYELARIVVDIAVAHGQQGVDIVPIASSEYPTAARRPRNSRLATDGIEADFGVIPRRWEQAVEDVMVELLGSAR